MLNNIDYCESDTLIDMASMISLFFFVLLVMANVRLELEFVCAS